MTVYSPSNAAGIIDDINNNARTSGDVVNLPDGNHDIDSDVAGATLEPAPGVTINGGASTVLQNCKLDGKMAGSANVLALSGFTIDITGMTIVTAFGPVRLANGTFILNDMRIGVGYTGGSRNAFTCDASTHATNVTCNNCELDHGSDDAVSTKAVSQVLGEASLLTLNNCNLHHCGDAINDQLLTAHTFFAINMNGGRLHTPGASARLVEPDISNVSINLSNVAATGGRIKNNNLIGCRLVEVNALPAGNAIGNYIQCSTATPLNPTGDDTIVRGNWVDATGSEEHVIMTGAQGVWIDANYIIGSGANFKAGIYYTSGVSTTGRITNNYSIGSDYAIYLRGENDPVFVMYNNIASSTDKALRIDNLNALTITSRNNIFPAGAFVNFTPDASDLVGVAADIDGMFVPFAGGNCDVGRGNILARPFIGGMDLYGRPKLMPHEDCIGPVYPQRTGVGNLLMPFVQIGIEIGASSHIRRGQQSPFDNQLVVTGTDIRLYDGSGNVLRYI